MESVPGEDAARPASAPADRGHVRDTGGDEFVLEIPVPGLEQEEITVEATSDAVTVVTRPRDGADA
jgi:HSP20 family molecular chaperone IbpA